LDAAIKKYEDLDNSRIEEENDVFLNNLKLNSNVDEKRKTAIFG